MLLAGRRCPSSLHSGSLAASRLLSRGLANKIVKTADDAVADIPNGAKLCVHELALSRRRVIGEALTEPMHAVKN